MRKIPTLFKRDPDNPRHVLPEVIEGCEWVLAGEGVPTRKYDGTCVMFDGTSWWARREVKPGKETPANYQPIETDENTGKTVGWEPMAQSAFARWHAEALEAGRVESGVRLGEYGSPGTYELIGPKVNGNPEQVDAHTLIQHDYASEWDYDPRTFEEIREAVLNARALYGFEGIVWHHPDGHMAKIKARDFPEGIRG